MGRETKLDDLVEKRICDALRDGHSYAAAARAGGIGEATLHEWIARGNGTDPDRPKDARYAAFAERAARAEHEAESRAVRVLVSAFDEEDARVRLDAAKWWLARRRPTTWAEQKGEPAPSEAEVAALVEKIRKVGT